MPLEHWKVKQAVVSLQLVEEMHALLLYVLPDLAVDPVKAGSLPHHEVVVVGGHNFGHLVRNVLS